MTDAVAEFGRRFNIPIAKVLPIRGEFIAQLDYDAAARAHIRPNLVRLRGDGSVAWTVHLADASDVVTNVDWVNGKLTVWTWSCHMITVDASTGAVLQSVFTK